MSGRLHQILDYLIQLCLIKWQQNGIAQSNSNWLIIFSKHRQKEIVMKAIVLGMGQQGKATIHDLESSDIIKEIIAGNSPMDPSDAERFFEEICKIYTPRQ